MATSLVTTRKLAGLKNAAEAGNEKMLMRNGSVSA